MTYSNVGPPYRLKILVTHHGSPTSLIFSSVKILYRTYKTCHEHFATIIDAYFEIILSKTDDLKNFGDLQVTTNYPYDGLEYISKDNNHDIHIMIQRNGSMSN